MSIRGPLDADRLRSALSSVAEGAEVLRTRLVSGAAGVLQVIGDEAPSWAVDEDWRGVAADEVARRVSAWTADALSQAEADDAPPVSASLHRVADDEHLLRVRLSAALADAASLERLAARVAAAYAGVVEDEEALQFADASEWQNDFLESDEAAEGRRLWKQRLAAARAASPLPMASHADAPAAPRLVPVPVDDGLLARLDAAAASVGVPASVLATTAWATLAHRLTGQTEARFAAEFDGRGFEELRGALGPFARFLPLAAEVGDGMRVADLARAVDHARQQAERWQDAFDAPDGAEPAAPLGFGWRTAAAPVEAGGLRWTVREAFACAEPFHAALLCAPSDGRLNARLLFDPARFMDEAAARLAEQAATVLAAVAADPHASVASVEVMGPRERAWVLETLGAGPANGAVPDETVLARILAVAQAHPAREVLRGEDGAMTYGALAIRIRALSARLRAAGIGTEARAGILLGRSPDAVAAMLAVMHAGGAYVPLDASYPRERLVYMLRDSGATVLITDDAHASLAGEAGCTVLLAGAESTGLAGSMESVRSAESTGSAESIESAGSSESSESTESAGSTEVISAGGDESAARAEGAAYVIYTSGTTGQPKGTVIEHRNLARYVRAAEAALDLPDGARYAVVSTLAADLGATMLFPALCRGGTLHLVSERRATDPEAWAEYASRHEIDCLKAVPSHLRLLMESAVPVLPRQRLVLGGEAAEAELVERVRRVAPELRVFNHYGPTETTVGVVAGEIVPGDGRPPLGRPLPGARVFLLDADGRLVPAGVPGEVHVGGGTVARGYLGRAAMTAGRFVPDPFSGQPGARMYCTGDRARWGADGRLEFLGRLDRQVKVNGWRTEPAEIEAALADHPDVAAARVVARDTDGGVRLAAYIVAAEGAPADADALRAHLRERLPAAFIPADLVFIPRLPLTPNGKVDLRALPDPASAAAAPREHVPPATPTETALVALWEAMLERTGVGVTDDFFDAGGNSFLAVRLMSRIHQDLGRRLPLAALIGAGNVRAMAALVDTGEGDAPDYLVRVREGEAGRTPLICFHPGEGTVLCYHQLARHFEDPGLPVYALQALDFEMGRAPLTAIHELAARYADAITARFGGEPCLLAGWSFGGLVAFEAARQLAARGVEVQRVLLLDCRLPVTGPALGEVDPALFRLSLLLHGSRLLRDGRPVVAPDELHGLDIHAQLRLLAERQEVDAQSLYPWHVPADRLEDYLEIREARTRGIQAYAWAPAPVALTLLRAEEAEVESAFPELTAAYVRAAESPDYGWGPLAAGPVDVVSVPGTHHSMFNEPHVRALAAAVERAAAAVRPAAR
nr:amino acid adenylation domain-containing protein [Longimicrobium terrae]